MLRRGKRKTSAEIVEFSVDSEDYKRFEQFAVAHRLTQDDALRAVLIEGINRYWPQQLAYMEKDYSELEKRFKEYSGDNEVLRNIYSQNHELGKLLEAEKGEGRGK